jgi:hypothetical protein
MMPTLAIVGSVSIMLILISECIVRFVCAFIQQSYDHERIGCVDPVPMTAVATQADSGRQTDVQHHAISVASGHRRQRHDKVSAMLEPNRKYIIEKPCRHPAYLGEL